MIYLDTNIFIYLLEGHPEYGLRVARELELLTAEGARLVTSVITITEFMCGSSQASGSILQQIPKLDFIVLNEKIATRAAQLKHSHASLKIGDAVHVATALTTDCKLFFSHDKALAKIAAKYLDVQTLD